MSSVDDRIVAMKFENKQFEQGIATSLSSMEKLKQGMNFSGAVGIAQKGIGGLTGILSKFGMTNPFRTATAGVAELQTATNKFSVGTMEGGITSVSKSWVAMSTIAITALSQVSSTIMSQVGQTAKNLVGIQAMTDGWNDYSLKIQATQTIMAGTGDSIETVSKYLKELDEYADQTIYSLSDMTSNISKFTNAGVPLKDSVAALKGIAQVAALSGAGTNEAARSMYNLGQAIGEGHVSLMNWRSVELANMGTVEFKQQLIDAAVAAGTLTKAGDGMYKTIDGVDVSTKNFGTTLQSKWLTSDALTETLKKYSDATTDIGKKATKAATEVKTFGMMMETLSAAAGTGWTDSYEILVGDLPKATKMWTMATDAIGGVLSQSAEARNEILKDWAKFGGRASMIQSVSNIWEALGNVLGPIREAFREIFPRKSGEELADLTKRFEAFTEKLIPGEKTMSLIKRTFEGVFAVFSIVGQVIGSVIDNIAKMMNVFGGGEGGVLGFTASIGDFLVALDYMLEKSGLIDSFFEGLGAIMAVPLQILGYFAGQIGKLFTGFDTGSAGKVTDALDTVGDKLAPLTDFAARVRGAFDGLGGAIGDALGKIGDAIASAFGPETFDKSLDAINTGLLAGILLLLKNFMTGGMINFDFGGGIFDSVKDTLGTLTTTLENMQAQLQADTLIKIAIALGILTASLVVLSMIDSKKLNKALLAMGGGFVVLQVSLSKLSSMISIFGAAKMPFIAAGLIGLAGAMLIMSVALKLLSTIEPDALARSVIAIGTMMVIITKSVGPLAANSKGMIAASIGMNAIATALIIMAVAVKSFAEMSYKEMARGLVGVVGALGAIAAAMWAMPPYIAMQATAILILSGALTVLANVVKDFADMKYEALVRGLVGLAGALGIIAGAMHLMPKGMVLQAAALILVGIALTAIQKVAEKFGGMSYEEMKKAAIALAGALLIIAGGLYLMSGTLSGSAALVIAAYALSILAPILITLGALSWENIIKGLAALAGVFVILGVAGAVLGPTVPVILGLSVAILLIGAGFALAGAGALAFAAAFGIVVAAGSAGIAVLSGLLEVIIDAIPDVMKAFAKGLIEMTKTLAKAGPILVKSFGKIIAAMLDAVILNAPKIGKAMLAMLNLLLTVIVGASPRIFAAGLDLILGFLRAIESRIGEITGLAASIIIKFMDALSKKQAGLIEAGVRLIISFINGLADAIDAHSYEMGQAGGRLAVAIIEGMVKGIDGGMTAVADAAMRIARGALDAAKGFLGIKSPSKEFEKIGQFVDEGFAKGIIGGEDQVLDAMTDMADKLKALAVSAAEDVVSLKAKLKDLKNDKNQDNEAIAKLEKRLELAKKLAERSKTAHEGYLKEGKDERFALWESGKAYDELTEKIEEQKKALEDLIDARDAEAASIAGRYSGMPDLTADDPDAARAREEAANKQISPEQYAAELAAKAAAVEQFTRDLATLRGMGMDDATYRDLLEKGIDAQPFVTKMIEGGTAMVETIDANTARLNTAAAALGTQAAADMHNAGIAAQQGLVNGLVADLSNLETAMAVLGAKLIKALKKALKIKSPSREFLAIGKMSDEGLAKGLIAYSGVAEKAAAKVGYNALDTLKHSMKNVGNGAGGPIGFTPVISPVLDLTRLQKESTKIGGMLETGITPSLSLDQASLIAANAAAAQDAASALAEVKPEIREIKIEQNNHSPKALSTAEIYRDTKSAVSLAKEALNIP